MDQKIVLGQIIQRLSEELGDGYTIEMEAVLKNNDVEKTGISIRGNEDILGAILYPRGLEEFCQKEFSEISTESHTSGYVETCVEELLQQYEDRKDQEIREAVYQIMEWDTVKTLIRPQLLSCKENQRLLGKLVYRRLHDLAIVYAVHVDFRSGSSSIYVKRKLFENWGISEEELHRQALKNMETDGYFIQDLSEILFEESPFLAGKDEPPLAVLTNRQRMYGAAGILLGSMLKDYAEKIGADLFLIPSSIHEVLLVPDDGKVTQDILDFMVREVNKTEVREEDRLSDHAYYYDCETGQIEMEKKVPIENAGEDDYFEGLIGDMGLLGAV